MGAEYSPQPQTNIGKIFFLFTANQQFWLPAVMRCSPKVLRNPVTRRLNNFMTSCGFPVPKCNFFQLTSPSFSSASLGKCIFRERFRKAWTRFLLKFQFGFSGKQNDNS
jgi:hypothetical protein